MSNCLDWSELEKTSLSLQQSYDVFFQLRLIWISLTFSSFVAKSSRLVVDLWMNSLTPPFTFVVQVAFCIFGVASFETLSQDTLIIFSVQFETWKVF